MKLIFKSRHIRYISSVCLALNLLVLSNAWAYGPFKTPATNYIKSGDRILLNQGISTRTGSKIYIQFGEVMARSEIEHAKPFCYFHLYRDPSIIDTKASLVADNFEIKKTINHYEAALGADEPLILALRGFITQDASQRTMITRFKLQSTLQPEVIELNCGIWAVPNERNHLSMEEMRSALGTVVTFELKGQ